MKHVLIILSLGFTLATCGGSNTPSNVESPGQEKKAKTKVPETGAAGQEASR